MKKKILFLLHIPPPVHGSSIVGNFIYTSRLINDKFVCSYINILASAEVHNTGKISISKIKGFILVFHKLLMELMDKKPDACYIALTVKGLAFYRDVIFVALLKMFKIKRIYHLHNKGVALKYKHLIYRYLYKIVFNNADVIVLSEQLYSDINSIVPKDRVYICPNGIPDNKNHSNKTTGESNQVKLLFLSNLMKSKGIFILLEACSILKNKGIAFTCDFIGGEGDVSAEQFRKKVQQFGLINEIKYLGKKYDSDKEKAFAGSDLFVFPTYHDCFPLVIIEAMQHHLPVISTFEGGIPKMIEDGRTGFLVPQKNATILADKIEILIKKPDLRQKLGQAGRKNYEENFTLEKFENNLYEILKEIC